MHARLVSVWMGNCKDVLVSMCIAMRACAYMSLRVYVCAEVLPEREVDLGRYQIGRCTSRMVMVVHILSVQMVTAGMFIQNSIMS